MIPEPARPQVDALHYGLQRIFGRDLVGEYLHGSVVLGCFGPHSDIDLLAVTQGEIRSDLRRRLLELLLSISGGYADTGPVRPVELDLIDVETLERWRHPAPFVFHYSESLRPRFESGELEPWDSSGNRDLAAHVVVVRRAGVALAGPPAQQLFPRVPDADFVDALLYDVDWWREHLNELQALPGGVRNAVLSLARIWATVEDGFHSKASGAEWALPRLPAALRPVLEHALSVYQGDEATESWETLPVSSYVIALSKEIDQSLYWTETTLSFRFSR